ncbi:MAG TPA: protease pro-enzyme activation domain-containing protein [Gaiellaceae bacterium]|nr:protease pro-enzyme activation domain-containing protein [Gaiellaceae bacterium]
MTRFARALALAVAASLVVAAGASSASKASWTTTRTQGLKLQGTLDGPLAPSTSLPISVALKLRNASALPQSIKAGAHLTPAQFAASYAPTAAAASSVATYLRGQGFSDVAVASNRLFVTAVATAQQAESAFDTTLGEWTVDGKSLYANSTAARVPASLGGTVLSVLGLNDAAVMQPSPVAATASGSGGTTTVTLPNGPTVSVPVTVPTSVPLPTGGSVPLPTGGVTPPATTPNLSVPNYPASYNPQGFWSAYDVGSTPSGSQTSVAIFGSGDMTGVVSDLRTEESANGLPQVPASVVYTGPVTPQVGDDPDEWDMDTQYSTGMAQDVAHLYIYSASSLTDSDLALAFNKFAEQDVAQAGSASFGECEYQSYLDGSMVAWDQVFAEAAAQGQTVFASSGDTGGFCPVAPNNGAPAGSPDVNYPASSPYVVAVGGTTLLTNSDGSYDNEIAWVAGGGGPSLFELQPYWQDGVAPPTGSTCVEAVACAGKTLPDVAMDADPNSGANVYIGGQPEAVGGTSLASPLALGAWARFESAHTNGLGFAAPDLYAQYGKTGFHDVDLGDTGPYPATPGYDLATGMGTFDIAQMAAAIGNGAYQPGATGAAYSVPAPACTGFTDASGDSAPPASTDNGQSLDILAGGFSAAGGNLSAELLVKSLSGGPGGTPGIAGDGDVWYVTWTYAGTEYFVSAELPGSSVDASNPTALPADFSYGTVGTSATGGREYDTVGSATGSIDTTTNVISITTPLSTVGGPAAGGVLATPGAQTFASVGTPAGGLLEAADTAGPGSNYTVGQGCSATTQATGGSGSAGASGSSTGSTTSKSSAGSTSSSGRASSAPASGRASSGVAGKQATKRRSVRGHGRVGRATFRLDLSKGPGSKLVYADSSNHLRFRALSFRIVYATHAATLVGRGMLDGRKVAFVAHAFDGHPRFLIAWSGGKPRGGAVTDGGIVIS